MQHFVGKHTMLPQKCIKNDMVHHGKPNALVGLCGLVQAINAHYWELKAEIACENQQSWNPLAQNPTTKLTQTQLPSWQQLITVQEQPWLNKNKEVLLSRRNPPLTFHQN